MSENYYKINEDGTVDKFNGSTPQHNRKNDPITGFLVGIGVSIVAAGIMAGVGILFETEIAWFIILATSIAGGLAGSHVTNPILGAFLGAIFSVISYVAYIVILALFGYGYADGETFSNIWIVIGAVSGAYMGYKMASDDD
jgi:hypothetical protein